MNPPESHLRQPRHQNGWRILADDLTGALDTAAAFRGPVPVWLDRPGVGGAQRSTQPAVSVISTATRDIEPSELGKALRDSLSWLQAADLAFKKVDSLLRGNTFEELRWLAEQGPFRQLTLAPAFPAQGRLTVNEQLVIQGQDPRAGFAFRERLKGLATPLAIPDITDDESLRRLAHASLGGHTSGHLWCGSAGLAKALAQAHDLAPQGEARQLPARGRRRVLISASHHPVTRRQWAVLTEEAASTHAVLLRSGDACALMRILSEVHNSGWEPDRPLWLDLSPHETLTAPQAQALLAQQTRQIAESLPTPDVLMVVGGDTLRALCNATGVDHLQAHASPWSGWGQAQWSGGAWSGVLCHSRSGAFGAEDDLLQRWRAVAAEGS